MVGAWNGIKLLWPWRKRTEAEQRGRDLMKYLLRDREGQKLLRTMRKAQKGGTMDPAFMQGPGGRELMAYLLRDEKGKDLLGGMMQGRQARRQLAHMSRARQEQLRQPERAPAAPAKKKATANGRRWRLPFFNRDAA